MRILTITIALSVLAPSIAAAQDKKPEPTAPATATATTKPEPTTPPTTKPEPTTPPTAPTATLAATDAPASVWKLALTPRLALTVPTSKLGPMVVGGFELATRLPVLKHRLVVALDIAWTRPSYSGSGSDPRVNGDYSYKIKETEVKIGLDFIYRIFAPGNKLVPFVGAGPVLHLLRTSETTSIAPGANTEQSSEIGFELLAGLDVRLGPGFLMGEFRVVYSKLDHVLTGDTNAGNLMIGSGYRVTF